MEPEPRRRLPPWAKSLILAGLIVVLGLPIILWLRHSADRAWKSMKDRTRAMFEEARSRSGARPVLYGTAEPGNAWTDYRAALDEFESIKDVSMVTRFVHRQPAANPATARDLVHAKSHVFGILRRGAHRAEGTFPYDWSSGARTRQLPASFTALSSFAFARSRFLQEEGRLRDAMDLLLDVLQFGSDTRRNAMMAGEAHGANIVSQGLDELKDLLLARRLTATELGELGRSLDVLDAHWPDFTVSLRNESMLVRTALETDEPEEILGKRVSPLKAWRHGFSVKRMAADAARQIETYVDESIRNQSLPWKERVAAQRKLQREIHATPNIFVKLATPGVSTHGTLEQIARTKLRLVRAAVHYLATGRFAAIVDPCGDTLKNAVDDGRVRIWSVGKDGDDQGGKGAWTPEPDFVLEVPK